MSKELVISSNRHETKVAVMEDDQLVEIYFQRSNEYSLAGSIHKGRVTRVLPGMQSAFVDLGLERDTFLYVSDFLDENGEEIDKISTPADEKANHRLHGVRPDRGDGRESREGRDRREPRESRESRESRDLQRSESAPPVQAPATVEESEAPAESSAVARPERHDEGDRGDRRGRRSRRRRTRGHGFPESKYASDISSGDVQERENLEPKASESPEEVFVLPGESLAKYRGRPSASESGDDDDTPQLVADIDDAEPDAPVAGLSEVDAGGLATAFPDPSYIAPSISMPRFEAGTPAEETPAARLQSPLAEPELTEAEAAGELSAEEADFAVTERGDSGEGADGSETAELELAPAAESSEEVASSESLADEIADAFDGEPESADGETETVAPASGPVSASVRDQGNRYQHRASRRMRRRGRGGDRDRGDREKSAEPPAPVTETPADRSGREKPALPSISDLLREGQEIIVQIAKEPLGQKGARITSHIALPGRYVVFMPTLEHLGVSRKIASDEERQRLKRILQTHRAGITGGFIVRTAGEGHSEDDIASDMSYLYNLWLDIRQKAEKKPAPLVLHHDLDIVQRILRDQLSDMFKAIWVDNEDIYESVVRFMQRFQPQLVNRVKLYTRPIPIFEAFNIAQEIEKALRPKVWLKSGGYIVINQTEALVAIDVNTGKYVGKSNRLEDTITKTNTEAVREIVRQIRLRDLGGIIVVDFIDMDERKNRQKVMQTLEETMRADRAPYKILQFNDFGLVAITRKRVKQSLERTLCSPCPTCEGAAYVKSVMTVVGEIIQEANKLRDVVEGKNVMLRTHPDVAKHLKSSRNSFLEEIEEVLARPVLVTSDPSLHPDKFDLAW